MSEKTETIGTNQGEKPTPENPISPEDAASAGPHEGDHQVVINISTTPQKEGK